MVKVKRYISGGEHYYIIIKPNSKSEEGFRIRITANLKPFQLYGEVDAKKIWFRYRKLILQAIADYDQNLCPKCHRQLVQGKCKICILEGCIEYNLLTNNPSDPTIVKQTEQLARLKAKEQ